MREKEQLFSYRMKQAEESLEDAVKGLAVGQSPRVVVNRAYYTVFYATLALFLYKNLNVKTSRHSTVITFFDNEFTRIGVFDKKYSAILHSLFDSRLEFDYKEFSVATTEKAEEAVEAAREFLSAVKEYVGKDLR